MKINIARLLLAMATACIIDGELCQLSGIAKPTLTQIKAGKRNPKPVTIGKLARVLNVDVHELIRKDE